jgi:hypothetical protein
MEQKLRDIGLTLEDFEAWEKKQPRNDELSLHRINRFMQELLESLLEPEKQPEKQQDMQPKRKYLFQEYYNADGEPVAGEYIMEIDNSSMEYFNACARSAEYQILRARGFNGNAATRYGSAIHHYLELRETGTTQEQAMAALCAMFASFPPLPLEEWRTVDHAVTAMEQYEMFYKQQDRKVVLLSQDALPLVEVPFRVPLTTIEVNCFVPWPENLLVRDGQSEGHFNIKKVHVYWTGKIDEVCLYDGKLSILDHKTSSMLGGLFYKEFELSSQTLGYCWAGRRAPYLSHLPDISKLQNFVLDVIVGRKPTKTGVAHEFERHTYTYTDEQIDNWAHNCEHIVADFLSHLVRGYFPMQTKWCVNKYGLCPFHDICVLPDHLKLSSLEQIFPPVTWSPLQ